MVVRVKVAAVQQDLMVDRRLKPVNLVSKKKLRKLGVDWYVEGDNHDYIPEDVFEIYGRELEDLLAAAKEANKVLWEAADYVASRNLWEEVGIPKFAVPLINYSLRNERDDHLIGRFDFAGGINRVPIKLIEYNGDTASLLPESVLIQPEIINNNQDTLSGKPYNRIEKSLKFRFQSIIRNNPNLEPNILLSSLGNEDDVLNTEVIASIARDSGFKRVQYMDMDKVIFSRDEGFFLEMGNENYFRFDYWFKFVPWDFMAFEEPELWEILESIITSGMGKVLNPAYSMLFQTKGILKIAADIAPKSKPILKATFSPADFPSNEFVKKPFYGRMGENVSVYEGESYPIYETEGDYGDDDFVYQELARFNEDIDEHRYQPSVFWTGEASGLCFRRQDDFVIDDDAEYVPHVVSPKAFY